MILIRQIGSELAKVFATKTWWLLALVLVVYTAFTSAFMSFFLSELGAALGGGASIPEVEKAKIAYATTTSVGYVFPLLIGALSVTGEYRYGTLTPTLLAQPRRGIVVAAKAIAMSLIGAIYGIAGHIGSVGAGATVLAVSGGDPSLGEPDVLALLARIVLAMALWGLIGVALGGLITNQVVVIVIVLAFTQFVEPILRTVGGLWDWGRVVGKFLPGAATDALAGAGLYSSLGSLEPSSGIDSPLLDWWQGGLVLFALALIALVVSLATTWRRDVA